MLTLSTTLEVELEKEGRMLIARAEKLKKSVLKNAVIISFIYSPYEGVITYKICFDSKKIDVYKFVKIFKQLTRS
jgi:hypothetical protein